AWRGGAAPLPGFSGADRAPAHRRGHAPDERPRARAPGAQAPPGNEGRLHVGVHGRRARPPRRPRPGYHPAAQAVHARVADAPPAPRPGRDRQARLAHRTFRVPRTTGVSGSITKRMRGKSVSQVETLAEIGVVSSTSAAFHAPGSKRLTSARPRLA